MGQVEQPRARLVQAREAGHPGNRPLKQVLLRGGRDRRAGEGVLQGCQQAPERAALGAVRAGPRGEPRHGNQPGLPHAQRRHVHVRAAQARPERVLRQALGVGGRHPHGADRVPPLAPHTPPPHPTEHGATPCIPQPWDVEEAGSLQRQQNPKNIRPLTGDPVQLRYFTPSQR